jgi:hypothetical protein
MLLTEGLGIFIIKSATKDFIKSVAIIAATTVSNFILLLIEYLVVMGFKKIKKIIIIDIIKVIE